MSGPETHGAGAQPHRPFIARTIRRFAIPIILGWLALIGVLVATVPPLEVVSKQNAVSASPADAPSMLAMTEMGRVFQESDYDSTAMIVLEADHELGDAEHAYYAELVDKLRADTVHVQHIQDFWGDLITAAGAQSADGKSRLRPTQPRRRHQGSTLGNASVEAVRDIVDSLAGAAGGARLRHRARAADHRHQPCRRQVRWSR